MLRPVGEKMSRASDFLVVMVCTGVVLLIYWFLAQFSGPVLLIHITVFWVLWLILSALTSKNIFLLLIPIFAFFVYLAPSYNYWPALLAGDLNVLLEEAFGRTGYSTFETNFDVLLNRIILFTMSLILVILTGRSIRRIFRRSSE